ncbi:GNAT family N-acetyltransferase [Shewanella sp. 10N.286.54.B9]|uniref:GNAT family N-acetyltransferase n=1 Tax=Shewanella sp. 10N.286.54.B9 TaxID=3229719 RepID=UPI003554669C
MLDIQKITELDSLAALKQQYYNQSVSPLDGMWQFGFVPMAQHYAFVEAQQQVGYCCINAEGYMLQFYLSPSAKTNANDLFTLIAQQNSAQIGTVKGAFVSTAEPAFLSLCLDNCSAVCVNSLMYQQAGKAIANNDSNSIELQLASAETLNTLVDFAVAAINAPEQWLTDYYGNLISRKELWYYQKDQQVLATGECRRNDEFQTTTADLGFIVAKECRGQGIAREVLKFLVMQASKMGLLPICSTESTNIAAQKAIANAGLVANHRILTVDFKQD